MYIGGRRKTSDGHPPASRDTSQLGRCPLCPGGRTQLPLSHKQISSKLPTLPTSLWLRQPQCLGLLLQDIIENILNKYICQCTLRYSPTKLSHEYFPECGRVQRRGVLSGAGIHKLSLSSLSPSFLAAFGKRWGLTWVLVIRWWCWSDIILMLVVALVMFLCF